MKRSKSMSSRVVLLGGCHKKMNEAIIQPTNQPTINQSNNQSIKISFSIVIMGIIVIIEVKRGEEPEKKQLNSPHKNQTHSSPQQTPLIPPLFLPKKKKKCEGENKKRKEKKRKEKEKEKKKKKKRKEKKKEKKRKEKRTIPPFLCNSQTKPTEAEVGELEGEEVK